MLQFISYPSAYLLANTETNVCAIDFANQSVCIRDTTTPTNNFLDWGTVRDGGLIGPGAKVTYTTPYLKLCRQSNGYYAYAPHNLCLQSQTFENANWTATAITVTADNTTAPDGTSTADLFTEATTPGTTHRLQTASNINYVNGVNYTLSVYAKAGVRTICQIALGGAFDAIECYANFDLAGGVVGTVGTGFTSSITAVGNGWYRCTLTGPATSTAAGTVAVGPTNATTAARFPTYTAASGQTSYYWGAQVNALPCQDLSYIATTTVAVYSLPYEWSTAGVAQGLVSEEARTNRALNNRILDNASGGWTLTNATVSLNNTTGIDGLTSADKIAATAGGACSIARTFTGSAAVWAVSAYVKNDTAGWCVLAVFNGTTTYSKNFDIANGALGANGANAPTTSAITAVGNGWYRISITATLAASASCSATLSVTDADSASDPDAGEAIFADLLQIELGAWTTSPILTGSSNTTRAIDTFTIAGTLFPLSQTTGMLYGKATVPPALSLYNHTLMEIGDNTANERIPLVLTTAGAGVLNCVDGGAALGATTSVNVVTTEGATVKIAGAYALNDFAVTLNGGTINADTSGTLPTTTQMKIGNNSSAGGVAPFGYYIAQLMYVPRRMTNVEMQTLTT